mgnify:CR=1 FL=1
MPSPLISAEWLGGALLILACTYLVMRLVRRRIIARHKPLTIAALRGPRQGRWRLGLMRMGSTDLEWFSFSGVSTRPIHVWARARLDVLPPGATSAPVALPLLPGARSVSCRYEGDDFEMALSQQDYRALRTWLESAPPSFNTDLTIA